MGCSLGAHGHLRHEPSALHLSTCEALDGLQTARAQVHSVELVLQDEARSGSACHGLPFLLSRLILPVTESEANNKIYIL